MDVEDQPLQLQHEPEADPEPLHVPQIDQILSFQQPEPEPELSIKETAVHGVAEPDVDMLVARLLFNDTFAQSNLGRRPRVAALSHTYAVKSPFVTMARPKFAPKSTPSRGRIPKPHYRPHPWTRPTYDAKRHPDPIRRFSTLHLTDRQTDRLTD